MQLSEDRDRLRSLSMQGSAMKDFERDMQNAVIALSEDDSRVSQSKDDSVVESSTKSHQDTSSQHFKLVPLRRNPTAKNSPISSPINHAAKSPLEDTDSLKQLEHSVARGADWHGPADGRNSRHGVPVSSSEMGSLLERSALERRHTHSSIPPDSIASPKVTVSRDNSRIGSALYSAGTSSLQHSHRSRFDNSVSPKNRDTISPRSSGSGRNSPLNSTPT